MCFYQFSGVFENFQELLEIFRNFRSSQECLGSF
jgi:hypothetical protein